LWPLQKVSAFCPKMREVPHQESWGQEDGRVI
jgi:hypothetical protein